LQANKTWTRETNFCLISLKSNKQTPKIDLLRILARRKLFTQPAGSEALGDGKFTDFSLQVPLRLCKLPLIEALSEVAKCIALKFLLQLTLTLSLTLSVKKEGMQIHQLHNWRDAITASWYIAVAKEKSFLV